MALGVILRGLITLVQRKVAPWAKYDAIGGLIERRIPSI